ncbi:type II and III secretion system protein [Chitinibacter sp. SCUT-21]|uniref:hypothetical protein n=1 Tax=Chitinibacter sp. SCUT-21 TaxID=2970891 RepID=UPI0035A6D1EF
MKRQSVQGLIGLLMLGMSLFNVAYADYVDSFAPRHKLASQLADVLQAAFPDASIKAFSGQIIVNAADQPSYERIRAFATQLDTATRSLQITVEQRAQSQTQQSAVGVDGELVLSNQGTAGRVELEMQHQQNQRQAFSQQRLRTLDGSNAMIMLGQQRFIPQLSFVYRPGYAIVQHGGAWQAAGTGFYVAPSLLGDGRISLKIAPQASSFIRDGSINVHQTYSEVEGRLGEWLPIGESRSEGSNDRRRIAGVDQQANQARYTVWVKVELQ